MMEKQNIIYAIVYTIVMLLLFIAVIFIEKPEYATFGMVCGYIYATGIMSILEAE